MTHGKQNKLGHAASKNCLYQYGPNIKQNKVTSMPVGIIWTKRSAIKTKLVF